MKSKIEIFKATFCTTTISIYLGLLVYSVFEIDFSNSRSLIDLFINCLSTSIFSGLVFGIFNATIGITFFKQKWLNTILTNIF